MVKMIFVSVLLVIVGLFLILKPDLVYQLTEGWKSYSTADPSDLYLKSTRFGGCVMLVVGIAAAVVCIFFGSSLQ